MFIPFRDAIFISGHDFRFGTPGQTGAPLWALRYREHLHESAADRLNSESHANPQIVTVLLASSSWKATRQILSIR